MRLALLLALTGCAENSLIGADDRPANASDTGLDGDVDDTDDPEADTATEDATLLWWSLSGEVTVTGGALDTVATTLTGHYTDTAGVGCDARVTVNAAAPVEALVAPVAVGWALTLSPVVIGACGVRTVPPLVVGVGPIDAGLYPAMDHAGFDHRTAGGYGLYADQAGAWVAWGLAGTADQLAGDTAAPTLPPLADGTYTWVPLYALPYPP